MAIWSADFSGASSFVTGFRYEGLTEGSGFLA
jgi:hypothetical protein